MIQPAVVHPHAVHRDPAVHQHQHHGENREKDGQKDLQQAPIGPEVPEQGQQRHGGESMQDPHRQIAVQVRRDRCPAVGGDQQRAKNQIGDHLGMTTVKQLPWLS